MDEIDRTIALLRRDVCATVGAAHEALIDHAAEMALAFAPPDRGAKIIEDVQQALHDTFVDVAWPACPRHPSHPLVFRARGWWCDRDQLLISPLGELATARP